jgi:hypothetical protein
MRRLLNSSLLLLLLLLLLLATPATAQESEDDTKELSEAEMTEMLEEFDARQRASGDYKALVYIEQKEKGKEDLLYEALIYRRDKDDKLVILFTKPKSEKGKGYLRIDKNLFLYDPNVGKWERRTERERIGGTGSRRRDFDESRLADEFKPSYIAREELGKYDVHHMKLTAREEADVAYPVMEVWIDTETNNILKLQEFALSGKLVRTTYYPRWAKETNEKTGEEVYFPKEIRIYDEIEEGSKTTMVFRAVDLKELPDNIFTKAWLESKSR